MKFEISLFRFDKNSDYLPYYTKHFIKIDKEKTLLDILHNINQKEKFFYEDNKNFDLVINNTFVKANICIKDLALNFGKDLVLEPISIKRCSQDLLINDDDFYKKLEILKDFINEEDKNYYESLKAYYYASNTLNYYDEYIGDTLILLAYKLIDENPQLEEKILSIIKKQEFSLDYHTNSQKKIFDFNKDFEKNICKLQEKLDIKDIKFQEKNLDFSTFQNTYEVKHNLEDFNIACYFQKENENFKLLKSKLKAKFLNFPSLNFDLGRKNKNLTLKIAKDILIDCFDNNADFLVVDNIEDFFIFDKYQKTLEKLAQRELSLSVLHINELQMLCIGKHEELKNLFFQHKIKPQLI